jgi:hypothetical protein
MGWPQLPTFGATMFKLDVWINVANLLYLFSYSVRDILWLRALTVIGALCLLPYY